MFFFDVIAKKDAEYSQKRQQAQQAKGTGSITVNLKVKTLPDGTKIIYNAAK